MEVMSTNRRRKCLDLSLSFIRLQGDMEGEAWGGLSAQSEFRVDYFPPSIENETPWRKRWPGLREALIAATAWGDIVGQQGAIIPGSAWLEFHFEGAARSSLCIAKPLDSLSAAAEFMAEG